MNIVHIIYSFNTGGAETMLVDIINRQELSHNVYLIIVNNSYNLELLSQISNNVKVILIGRRPASISITSIIKLNYELLKINPDIIHLHSYTLPKMLLFKRRKIWYTAHSLNIPMTYAKYFNGIIAISEAVKNDVLSRCNAQVYMIPNGINTESIKIKDNWTTSDAFKIVQVARLDHNNKGQDILIKAISILKNMGVSDISVDFIGVGDSETYLKDLSYELNVVEQINFIGLRNREYIYDHLKDYDLMCHPSRYEGFGLTVAEGMAAKLPVLVPMTGGPWEILEKGKYGIGFNPTDPEDCAAKILEIKERRFDLSEMVELGYKHIVEKYSINRMVDDYLKIYNL